ncbi:unnamed protein product [Ectocarpus sp. 12 AP-2014]
MCCRTSACTTTQKAGHFSAPWPVPPHAGQRHRRNQATSAALAGRQARWQMKSSNVLQRRPDKQQRRENYLPRNQTQGLGSLCATFNGKFPLVISSRTTRAAREGRRALRCPVSAPAAAAASSPSTSSAAAGQTFLA